MQRIRQDSPTEMVCETRKPTDFLAADVVSQGTVDQIRWERDLALSQLESIGKGLGSKMDDVAEVKHGHWVAYPIADGMNRCSVCGVLRFGESNYCPMCGASMDEVSKDE